MINYKQILEAVNRGIKFALDDFEDQDELQGQTNSKVNNTSNLREYLEWQELTNKFETHKYTFDNISVNDVLKLGELSKLLNIKYKISLEKLFNFIRNCINKQESLYHADLNWIDTSGIYTMENLFFNSKFNGDISEWDVSNVENMTRMFYNSYFDGDISNWDVSKVKTMYEMFKSSWFKGDISNWDVSNVTDMEEMFQYTSFNSNISKWDVSKCRDFKNMFMNNLAFNQDLSNWKIKKGSNTNMMFWGTIIVNNDNYMPQFV